MRLYYDLHIHSALSPCGDEDMTPNNIVNMSVLKGLDLIAVTDHNSCRNAKAVMKAADGKIIVIPGLEITTSEEVHVLCYFPNIEAAEDMSELVRSRMQGIRNKPEIFGRQLVMNEMDEVVDEEEYLLVNAVNLDIYETAEETHRRGGVFVPAHIDRSSYSVLANLGFLPPDLLVDALEITESNVERLANSFKSNAVLTSSDAHYLENIAEKNRFMDTTDKMTKNIIKILCNI